MISHRKAALALGLTLAFNTGAGVAIAATEKEPTGLNLEGFSGFPAPAEDEAENAFAISSDLASTDSGKGEALRSRSSGAGEWDRATMIAAVVAGFGLTGALALRSKAPALGKWLGQRGLSFDLEDVEVLAVKPLGAGNSLAVVEVYGQRLVLGVSAGQITLLTTMDKPATIQHVSKAPTTTAAPTFGKTLNRAIGDPAAMPPSDPDTRELAPPTVPVAEEQAAPPRSESISSVLKDVLARKQNRKGEGVTWNRTLDPAARQRPEARSAAAPKRPQAQARPAASSPASGRQGYGRAPAQAVYGQGAANQVIRKIQTMRRFR